MTPRFSLMRTPICKPSQPLSRTNSEAYPGQKRINNLLTKVTEDEVGDIEATLFEHPSEQALVDLANTLNETKGLPLLNRLAALGQGLSAIKITSTTFSSRVTTRRFAPIPSQR